MQLVKSRWGNGNLMRPHVTVMSVTIRQWQKKHRAFRKAGCVFDMWCVGVAGSLLTLMKIIENENE